MPTTPPLLQLPFHPPPLLPCLKAVSGFLKGPFLLAPPATVPVLLQSLWCHLVVKYGMAGHVTPRTLRNWLRPTTCDLPELQALPLLDPTALAAFRLLQALGVGELGLHLRCERFRNNSTQGAGGSSGWLSP